MKLYICGQGRHGKDTVAEMMAGYLGLTFASSSWFVCERFIFSALEDRHGYSSPQECFDDRENRRADEHLAAFGVDLGGARFASMFFNVDDADVEALFLEPLHERLHPAARA